MNKAINKRSLGRHLAGIVIIPVVMLAAPSPTLMGQNTAPGEKTGSGDEKITVPRIDAKERTGAGVKERSAEKADGKNPSDVKSPAAPGDPKKPSADGRDQEEKKVKWIKDTMSYGIQKERREAISYILSIRTESYRQELYDLLVQMLKTEYNSEAKTKILTIMAEMKIKRGEAEVLEKINDESEDVRVAAVYALKSLEAVSSRGTLAEKLQKENMETDSRFIEALLVTLGEFKAVELMPLVKEKVESNATAQSVREKMVLYLGQISSPESTALLLKIYNDEEEEVIIRSYAVNSLAKLGAKEAAPDIKKVLSAIDSLPFKKKQAYYNLSLYSTAALVKLGDPDAMPRLMDAMKSDSASVRLRSVELMKEMKDKRTIDILKYKMEYDSDARVRKAAGEALKQMGVEVEKKDDKKAGSDKKASPEKPYRPQDLKKETETKDENPASPGSDETPDSVKGDQKKNTGRPGSAARPAR